MYGQLSNIKPLYYDQVYNDAKAKKNKKHKTAYFSPAVKYEIEYLINMDEKAKDAHAMRKLCMHLNVVYPLRTAQGISQVFR